VYTRVYTTVYTRVHNCVHTCTLPHSKYVPSDACIWLFSGRTPSSSRDTAKDTVKAPWGMK